MKRRSTTAHMCDLEGLFGVYLLGGVGLVNGGDLSCQSRSDRPADALNEARAEL